MDHIVNSTVCRMLHECLHSVLFSLFISYNKYWTTRELQACKSRVTYSFEWVDWVLEVWLQQLYRVDWAVMVGPNVISFHGAQNPWWRPWTCQSELKSDNFFILLLLCSSQPYKGPWNHNH